MFSSGIVCSIHSARIPLYRMKNSPIESSQTANHHFMEQNSGQLQKIFIIKIISIFLEVGLQIPAF